jgi:uncharacterized membrane protein
MMATYLSEIRRRVRAHDVEREMWYNRTRKGTVAAYLAARASGRVPALLPEFLKMLLGSMIGFWLIAAALSFFFGAQPIYTYAVLGLVFSLQATYYKYQLARNPDFRIRSCNCGGAAKDGTETVLKSSASTIVGIPNSVFGIVLYGVLIALLYQRNPGAALLAAGGAALLSAYLAYSMIVRIKGLCSTCINIAALNALILWVLT